MEKQPYLITALFYSECVNLYTLVPLGVSRQTKMTKLVYAYSYDGAKLRFGEFIKEAMKQMNSKHDTYHRVRKLTFTNDTIQ